MTRSFLLQESLCTSDTVKEVHHKSHYTQQFNLKKAQIQIKFEGFE